MRQHILTCVYLYSLYAYPVFCFATIDPTPHIFHINKNKGWVCFFSYLRLNSVKVKKACRVRIETFKIKAWNRKKISLLPSPHFEFFYGRRIEDQWLQSNIWESTKIILLKILATWNKLSKFLNMIYLKLFYIIKIKRNLQMNNVECKVLEKRSKAS